MREQRQVICVRMCVEIAWDLRGNSAHKHAYKHNKNNLRFFTRFSLKFYGRVRRRFHGQISKISRPDTTAGLHGKFVTCTCIFRFMTMIGSVCVYMCVCVCADQLWKCNTFAAVAADFARFATLRL